MAKTADQEVAQMEAEAAPAGDQGEKYSIKALLAMTPEQQLEVFGLNDELEEIIERLQEADKLSGKPRQDVEDEIQEMFEPNIDGDRIRWAIEDAKRRNATGKQALADGSPCSVLD